MPNAKGNLEKLKELLAELFQFERVDLDFGIYRIMNQKRAEITRFLDQDLLPQVKEAFKAYETESKAAIEADLIKAVEHAKSLGVDPETVPKVRELRQKASEAADLTALEQEVYSHLYNFFRRYYQDGDFLSLRRYKEGVYAIPYEGEEVKLHWANNDQYYIKTSEFLRNYTFKLPSGRRVHFKMTQADVKKDNTQPASDTERRFVLATENPVAEENGDLAIRFEFRILPEKRKQVELNAEAIDRILKKTKNHKEWLVELAQPRPTEKKPTRTLLEKHLDEYTARYTFDYFIHKDLATFLSRELDFYIKNEVMHLDDIEEATAPRAEQYINTTKAIRAIARKLIALLSHIEDFQKKLWLKKKFVIETNYCVTLDRIPEWLYAEIAKNDAQREEWVSLFAINEIKKDLARPGYAKPLTVEFLKANPHLVLDTKFFSHEFKDRLLASIDDLDDNTDGILIYGENFQALNLLRDRYQKRVGCIYIDPPYNTGPSEIIYKNDYKYSSWLSLMENRLSVAQSFMIPDESVLIVAIDDYEVADLKKLLELLLPGYDISTVIVNHHPQGSGGANVSRTHEYAYFLTPKGKDILRVKKPEGENNGRNTGFEERAFMRSGTGENNFRRGRPNSFYAILVDPKTLKVVGAEPPPTGSDYPKGKTKEGFLRIYPIGEDGAERVWRRFYESGLRDAKEGKLTSSPKFTIKQLVKERPRTLPFSNWTEKKYNAGTQGTNLLADILGLQASFPYPKSLYTVLDAVDAVTYEDPEATVFDFFGGSGTTGHAVIKLNREDGGRRKYILVEMGDYFENVLKPRIQKVIYSHDWKEGKPVSRHGSSHIFKYMRIESYEDALNNLELARTEAQQKLLKEYKEFRESYMLSYMMDVETKGSPSLLKIDAFEDPLNYSLKIATGNVGETKPTPIDLAETFNCLLGLKVKSIKVQDGFRVVTGTSPDGQNALVIWRNLKKHTNEALEEFFRAQKFNAVAEQEFDVVYVNGSNTLENLRRETHTWKVLLTEEEFQRLMFDFKTA